MTVRVRGGGGISSPAQHHPALHRDVSACCAPVLCVIWVIARRHAPFQPVSPIATRQGSDDLFGGADWASTDLLSFGAQQ